MNTQYISGNKKFNENGVAIVLNRKVVGTVLGYKRVDDRIISLRIQGYIVNYTIIQVYSRAADVGDQGIQDFYDKLQKVIDTKANGDALFVIGDCNAKVGDKEELGIVGRHGLGNRNSARERLIEFCAANKFLKINTFFQQPTQTVYLGITKWTV